MRQNAWVLVETVLLTLVGTLPLIVTEQSLIMPDGTIPLILVIPSTVIGTMPFIVSETVSLLIGR